MPADFSSVAASKDTTTARKYLRAVLFLNFDFRSALLKKITIPTQLFLRAAGIGLYHSVIQPLIDGTLDDTLDLRGRSCFGGFRLGAHVHRCRQRL
jgi:hypothetical protein